MGTFVMRVLRVTLDVGLLGIFYAMEEAGAVHRGLNAISVGVHEVLPM